MTWIKKEAVQGNAAFCLRYIQYMINVVLVFPDTISMVDFLLIYKVKGIETNSVDLTLCGSISEKLISTAMAEYGAEMVDRAFVEWE